MEGNEVKPWVVLVMVVICILIITPLCFWLGKQFANKDEKKNEESKEVSSTWVEKNKAMSMAWNDNKIVVLTTDGKEIEIDAKDLDSNTKTFFTDEKLYTYSYGPDKGESILGYIDFNDDYKYTQLATFERTTIPESVIVVEDHAYISLAGKKYVIDYDLKEKKDTKLNYFDDYFNIAGHGSFMLYYVNNQVYYLTRGTIGEEPHFGTIDLATGKKQNIEVNGYVNYVYDNKFIFNYDYYRGNEYVVQYYEYDTETKKVNKISGVHLDGGASAEQSFIMPFGDAYVYMSGDQKIYKYEDGKDKELEEIGIYSFDVYKISEDEILLLEGGLCELDDCEFKQYIYNVKEDKLEETTDYTDKYYNVFAYFG